MKKVLVAYYVNGPLLSENPDRRDRERMRVCVKPQTVELNKYLAKYWAPSNARYPGRAIDGYSARFWWHYVTPRKLPPKEWGTRKILEEMLEEVKRGNKNFISLDLVLRPCLSRLIDYLAKFWYIYEGGKKYVR